MNDELIFMYDRIKKLVQKFIKKSYFEEYNPGDLFINRFVSINKNYITRFNNAFFSKYNSIEIYSSNHGYNYLYDALTIDNDFLRYYELEGFVLMLLPSEALTYDDGKIIHRFKKKIRKEDNLLIFKHRYGKGRSIPSLNELETIYSNLEFIDSLISNDDQTIIEAFNENKCVMSVVDLDKLEYSSIYRDIPYLERMPKNQKANIDFAKEYKEYVYDGEAYLFASFYPMVVKETKNRPLLITYIIPNKSITLKYMIDGEKTYKDVIFGVLDSIFEETKALPEKLYIDNRELFASLSNTLKEMHIEHELFRNTPGYGDLDALSNNILKSKVLKPGLRDDSLDIRPKEDVITFLDYMIKSLENVDLDTEEYDDLDFEDDIENNSNPDSNDTDLVA